LPFFPKAAWAFVDGEGSFDAARRVFEPGPRQPHAEGADAAIRLAWRGRGDMLGGDFASVALAVFGPLREHVEPRRRRARRANAAGVRARASPPRPRRRS
jgi:hypothetical protein